MYSELLVDKYSKAPTLYYCYTNACILHNAHGVATLASSDLAMMQLTVRGIIRLGMLQKHWFAIPDNKRMSLSYLFY